MNALLVAALLAAPAAPTTPAPRSPWGARDDVDVRAKDAFAGAKKLFSQRRYAEAIVKFQEAYAFVAHPVILYNIGKCHERMNETALALRNYREYVRLDSKVAGDPVVRTEISNAERRLREKGLQQLVIYVEPSSARITVDGHPLPQSPAYVELNAGTHIVTASAPGFEPEARTFVADLRRISEMTIGLRSATQEALNSSASGSASDSGETSPAVASASSPAGISRSSPSLVLPIGLVALGVGAAAAIAGAVALATSPHVRTDAYGNVYSDDRGAYSVAQTHIRAGAGLLVGGLIVAAMGGGALLWAYLKQSPVMVSMAPSQGGGMLAVWGAF
jgi:hypothetical protein